jgi:hypothetical protein
MYKQVTEILENCYGDHHLEAAFHSQLKRRTQFVGEFLQELSAAIDHMYHHAHIGLPKHLLVKKLPVQSPTG